MYLSEIRARNFRLFGEGQAELNLHIQHGFTALIGRNDTGKTAIIDAIRLVLLTRDQEYLRVSPDDFHIDKAGIHVDEIYIRCKFTELSSAEKGALLEHLTYEGEQVSLYVTWTARRLADSPAVRRWLDVSVRSGSDGAGPPLEVSVREFLSAAYLRPLRDAEREMSPGRGSRLSQILANVPEISTGDPFDPESVPQDPAAVAKLGLVGLSDYLRHSIQSHTGVESAQNAISEHYLQELSLQGDALQGKIDVSEGGNEAAKLRQILERLELGLFDAPRGMPMGRYGLGSNNLLFMACELLLLGKEPEGLPLLLIEEPEAHLHPQRQLRLMEFIRDATEADTERPFRPVQVLMSTHSPNLASRIPLRNLVLLDRGRTFSLAPSHTRLNRSDYRFLERFLDVTKANLFFAHGVLIVEGDAEAILLPTIARQIGRDLASHGVSIVNVGGRGLYRFGRIFLRSDEGTPPIGTPVACVTDMDVMPDCAPMILGLVKSGDDERWESTRRRWKVLRDFGDDETQRSEALAALRGRMMAEDAGHVRTFVSDHWTLEYDLSRCGLAKEVYIAACLAKNDDPLNEGRKGCKDIVAAAEGEFVELEKTAGRNREVLGTTVYLPFHSGAASKAVAAQYLAERLPKYCDDNGIGADGLRALLPSYIVEAIDHVTDVKSGTGTSSPGNDSG